MDSFCLASRHSYLQDTFDRAECKTICLIPSQSNPHIIRRIAFFFYQVDVIVVSSSSQGLIKSLLRSAGSDVRRKYEQKTASATMPQTFAIKCANLLCREILFIPWSPCESIVLTEQTIRNFLSEAINYVIDRGYNSVAFPAIGCGQFELDADVVAHTMIDYIKMNECPLDITFAIHPKCHSIFDSFRSAYGNDFDLWKYSSVSFFSIEFRCSCLAECIGLCR